jgi:hypothetical protein
MSSESVPSNAVMVTRPNDQPTIMCSLMGVIGHKLLKPVCHYQSVRMFAEVAGYAERS